MTFAKLCKYIRIATYVAIIIDAAIKIVKTARGEDEKPEKKKQQPLFESDGNPGTLKGGNIWIPPAGTSATMNVLTGRNGEPVGFMGRPNMGKSLMMTSVYGMPGPVTVAEAVKRTMENMRRADHA